VSEPPKEGRPPGYAGDVGSFELRATVEPRSIPVGGSVAVTARVKGRGRLPGSLLLPEQSGSEWLEPTVRDEASVENSVVGGTRSFSYLVRMTKPGTIDLGSLRLPQFDPATGRYRVQSFALGNVSVEAPASGAAPDDAAGPKPGPRLSDEVRFRPALGAVAPKRYWTDRGFYWWTLGLGPSLVLGAAGLLGLAGRVRRSLASRADSQATHATRALADARQALAAGPPGAVASAAERALYNAIEWSTGVKARAVLRADLGRELSAAGLPEELASRLVAALDASGQLRFGAGDPARARAVVDDAEGLVKQLVRRAPRARSRAAEEARA
jgi:hypothetical protein